MSKLLGIHHVTAICGDPQKNLDFYTGELGLRLVKLTVNFDDPTAYHLYYGDGLGSPGTLMTFFPYQHGATGARGAGSFLSVSLAVPEGSLEYWMERLKAHSPELHTNCHGEKTVMVEDPDGMHLHLVEAPLQNKLAWTADVAANHAIQRIAGVTLGSRATASSVFAGVKLELPIGQQSMTQSGKELTRFQLGDQFLDVMPTEIRSLSGRGSIHHVAYRVYDDAEQLDWKHRLEQGGAMVSDVKDRKYFHSIYFREPGGALFEIATDGPGMTADESGATLGQALQLPPGIEHLRSQVEAALPKLRVPAVQL